MAFDNFKEKVWAEGIQMELDTLHVFGDGVNREYEGEIKDLGDTVRIKQIGKPTMTVGDMADGRDITLSDPEEVPESALSVVVDHYITFNYMVQDIDKAQGAKNVMSSLNRETSEGIADVHDKFIADLAKATPGIATYNDKFNSGNVVTLTKDNLFNVVDLAQQMLFENNVSPNTPLELIFSPWVNTLFRQSFIKMDTDNSGVLKNGKVGMYGAINLKMSNNVAVDGSGNFYIQLRTKRAIAFINQETHLEPYRPEKKFSDAMKGLDLYGGKIVRPKEIVTIICKPN